MSAEVRVVAPRRSRMARLTQAARAGIKGLFRYSIRCRDGIVHDHWYAQDDPLGCNLHRQRDSGNGFFLTTNPASNLADIALTTTGQLSVTTVLTAGTYYISIQLAVMGPGFYSITYNPSSSSFRALMRVTAPDRVVIFTMRVVPPSACKAP